VTNRFEKTRAALRARITELEDKYDVAAADAARLLIGGNMNGFEATTRHGKRHAAVIEWLGDVLLAVDRVEAEAHAIEQNEASKQSMLLAGLRSDSVEADTLRDLAERVHRNLSWRNPVDGRQKYGAALGRELRDRRVQIEAMDLEILMAASKTKRSIGSTSHEAAELLRGYQGEI
jgi:hypothetical protein